MEKLVAGVDLGGTKIYLALGYREGELVDELEIPTRVDEGVDTVVGDIYSALEYLCSRSCPGLLLDAVGVGAPGPLDHSCGMVCRAPNLGWENVPLADRMQEYLQVPVAVENDANAAALGEYYYGAAAGMRNVIYVTVSTGIGGGLIFDGRVYHGATGSAGEVGHIIVDPEGPRCGCGHQGCLEAVASGTAMARRAQELVEEGRGKAILKEAGDVKEEITAVHVAWAAGSGDAEALVIMDEAGRIIGRTLAGLVNLLNPDMIVLGGGVIKSGNLILDPIKEECFRYSMQTPAEVLKIEKSVLGSRAGVMGALALGFSLL